MCDVSQLPKQAIFPWETSKPYAHRQMRGPKQGDKCKMETLVAGFLLFFVTLRPQ